MSIQNTQNSTSTHSLKCLVIGAGLAGSYLIKAVAKKGPIVVVCTTKTVKEKKLLKFYLNINGVHEEKITELITKFSTNTYTIFHFVYNIEKNNTDFLWKTIEDITIKDFDYYFDCINRETLFCSEVPNTRNISKLQYIVDIIKELISRNSKLITYIATTTGTGGIDPLKMPINHGEDEFECIKNKVLWKLKVYELVEKLKQRYSIYKIIPAGAIPIRIHPVMRGPVPAYGILKRKLGNFLKNNSGIVNDIFYWLGESGPHTQYDLMFIDGFMGFVSFETLNLTDEDIVIQSKRFTLPENIYKSKSNYITYSPIGPAGYLKDILLWWVFTNAITKNEALNGSNAKSIFEKMLNTIKIFSPKLSRHSDLGVTFDLPEFLIIKSSIERIIICQKDIVKKIDIMNNVVKHQAVKNFLQKTHIPWTELCGYLTSYEYRIIYMRCNN